ncbi:MAG: hypothetical protein WA510_18340, partial [Acidobacteriaceae bacterium]
MGSMEAKHAALQNGLDGVHFVSSREVCPQEVSSACPLDSKIIFNSFHLFPRQSALTSEGGLQR